MKTTYLFKIRLRILFLLIFSGMSYDLAFSQNITRLQGIVKDSVTMEPLPFVTIKFDGTTIGTYSDDNGKFNIQNKAGKTTVFVSYLGYKPVQLEIPAGQLTYKEIFLQTESYSLNEVIIKPKKQKYSKKNNPAVDLIKNVIAYKDSNNIRSKEYFQCSDYERILFALNDFKQDQRPFNKYKFLPEYVDTSIINNKLILPFSVHETSGEVYYRKKPKTEKRLIKAFNKSGIDDALNLKGIETVINEVFKDVSIYDNNMTFLMEDFISPLNIHSAVNFYRWYIIDTVTVDNELYTNLAFAPFNSHDIGLTGNLYISTDGTYAVKNAEMKVPRKINMNYVDELIIRHEFERTEDGKWAPSIQRVAVDLSLYGAVKFHVDKSHFFDHYLFDRPADSVYNESAPVLFAEGYDRKTKEFWTEERPLSYKDPGMDEMIDDIRSVSFFNFLIKAGRLISGGYVHTASNPDSSKIDIGTLLTLYSYNSVEGNRFRGTVSTTPVLNRHLSFYGYGAYGTRDDRFKYFAETTWSFREVKEHKDEFPRNNLTIGYRYDVNDLGQHYTQAERDYLFMSFRSSEKNRSVYNRRGEISYHKEYYNGFSFKLTGSVFDERPAGNLLFNRLDENNNLIDINSIRSTEGGISLRYAPNEKFFQQKRRRYAIPSEKFILNLSYTGGMKGVLGGMYDYDKVSFSAQKELWVPPYGKMEFFLFADKLWGEAPFPLLISPNANSSFTIQDGTFYLLEPLEFLHNKQVSWEINYRMGGWFFNRIPLINKLKLREVFGFRGLLGDLSDRNNPFINRELLLFPDDVFQANKKPYMEYNIGIENIFGLIRIDYVKRINYLDHPDINKNGIRFSAVFSF